MDSKRRTWLKLQESAAVAKNYFFRFYGGVNDHREDDVRLKIRCVLLLLVSYLVCFYGHDPDHSVKIIFCSILFLLREYRSFKSALNQTWAEKQIKRRVSDENAGEEAARRSPRIENAEESKESSRERPLRRQKMYESFRYTSESSESSSCWEIDSNDDEETDKWREKFQLERRKIGFSDNPLLDYCYIRLAGNDSYDIAFDWSGSYSEFEPIQSFKFIKLTQKVLQTRWRCKPCMELATNLVAPAVYLQELANAMTDMKLTHMMGLLSSSLDSVISVLDKIEETASELKEKKIRRISFGDRRNIIREMKRKRFVARLENRNEGIIISEEKSTKNFYKSSRMIRENIRIAVGEMKNVVTIESKRIAENLQQADPVDKLHEELNLVKMYIKNLQKESPLDLSDFIQQAKDIKTFLLAMIKQPTEVKEPAKFINSVETFLTKSALKYYKEHAAKEEERSKINRRNWEELSELRAVCVNLHVPCKLTIRKLKITHRELHQAYWEQDMKNEILWKMAHCGLDCRIAGIRHCFLDLRKVKVHQLQHYNGPLDPSTYKRLSHWVVWMYMKYQKYWKKEDNVGDMMEENSGLPPVTVSSNDHADTKKPPKKLFSPNACLQKKVTKNESQAQSIQNEHPVEIFTINKPPGISRFQKEPLVKSDPAVESPTDEYTNEQETFDPQAKFNISNEHPAETLTTNQPPGISIASNGPQAKTIVSNEHTENSISSNEPPGISLFQKEPLVKTNTAVESTAGEHTSGQVIVDPWCETIMEAQISANEESWDEFSIDELSAYSGSRNESPEKTTITDELHRPRSVSVVEPRCRVPFKHDEIDPNLIEHYRRIQKLSINERAEKFIASYKAQKAIAREEPLIPAVDITKYFPTGAKFLCSKEPFPDTIAPNKLCTISPQLTPVMKPLKQTIVKDLDATTANETAAKTTIANASPAKTVTGNEPQANFTTNEHPAETLTTNQPPGLFIASNWSQAKTIISNEHTEKSISSNEPPGISHFHQEPLVKANLADENTSGMVIVEHWHEAVIKAEIPTNDESWEELGTDEVLAYNGIRNESPEKTTITNANELPAESVTVKEYLTKLVPTEEIPAESIPTKEPPLQTMAVNEAESINPLSESVVDPRYKFPLQYDILDQYRVENCQIIQNQNYDEFTKEIIHRIIEEIVVKNLEETIHPKEPQAKIIPAVDVTKPFLTEKFVCSKEPPTDTIATNKQGTVSPRFTSVMEPRKRTIMKSWEETIANGPPTNPTDTNELTEKPIESNRPPENCTAATESPTEIITTNEPLVTQRRRLQVERMKKGWEEAAKRMEMSDDASTKLQPTVTSASKIDCGIGKNVELTGPSYDPNAWPLNWEPQEDTPNEHMAMTYGPLAPVANYLGILNQSMVNEWGFYCSQIYQGQESVVDEYLSEITIGFEEGEKEGAIEKNESFIDLDKGLKELWERGNVIEMKDFSKEKNMCNEQLEGRESLSESPDSSEYLDPWVFVRNHVDYSDYCSEDANF